MIKTIDGRRYLMRDRRPISELRRIYKAFVSKYGDKTTFHEWLNRGRIYMEIKKENQ